MSDTVGHARLESTEQSKQSIQENARYASVLEDTWGPGASKHNGADSVTSRSTAQDRFVGAGVLPPAGDLLNVLMAAQHDGSRNSDSLAAQKAAPMQAEGPVLGDHKNHIQARKGDKPAVGNDPEGMKLGELKREPTEIKALEHAISSVFLFSGGKNSTKEYTAAIAQVSPFGKDQYVSSHTFAGGKDVTDPAAPLRDIGIVWGVRGFVHNHPDIDGRAYWLASQPDCDSATQYGAPEYIITPKGEILRWQAGDPIKKDANGYPWGVPKHVGDIDSTGKISWLPKPMPLKGYELP